MSSNNVCPWADLNPASIEFCERRLCHWVVEPANTWSNIGFIIVGVFVLLDNRKRDRHALSLIGLTAILGGIGSAMFHATGSRIGEIVDVSAMYLVSSLFLVFYIKRFFNSSLRTLIFIYLTMNVFSITSLVMSQSNGIILFTIQIAVSVFFEIAARLDKSVVVNQRHLRFLVAGFIVAFTCWVLDIRNVICDPENHILGGHAIWHLANATCLWNFYKFQEQFFPPAKS